MAEQEEFQVGRGRGLGNLQFLYVDGMHYEEVAVRTVAWRRRRTDVSSVAGVKLRVSSGKPDQLSCGEMSNPPAPKMPLTCSRASCSPLAMDSEVNEKVLIDGMKS